MRASSARWPWSPSPSSSSSSSIPGWSKQFFTNRYGKSSWIDALFYFVDAGLLLYLSNSFTDVADYRPFLLVAGLLSLTLFVQYGITCILSKKRHDKQIALTFSGILLFRSLILLVGGILNTAAGLIIALTGILLSWIAPGLTGKYTSQCPIIFSHLLERLTLLTIITFGETIVGIAAYFLPSKFSPLSVLVFAVVALLFVSYVIEFDQLIDEDRTGETGNALIYLHYPILFGISLVTVSLNFISESEADLLAAVSYLFCGIGLFYLGIWLARRYNQTQCPLPAGKGWLMATSVVVCFGLNLISRNALAIAAFAAFCAGINGVILGTCKRTKSDVS